ncbi:major centromere autoantigen B-like isoform X2 [Thrips palmi]|uniref:Major centromere autoantigen B-like isoform X2 n=1 Tax=Thrips palmi TaxID=161013 RepID=A0A6P8ZRK3_THRPL|nr:major centromere autoantigen B-like isoform X2 [Thrips palmi]
MADDLSRRRKLYRRKTRDANFKRRVSDESSSDSEPDILTRANLKRSRLDGSSSSTSGNQNHSEDGTSNSDAEVSGSGNSEDLNAQGNLAEDRDGDEDGDEAREGGDGEESDDSGGFGHNVEEIPAEGGDDRQPDNSEEMSDENAGEENVNDEDDSSEASGHVASESESDSETEHSDQSNHEEPISDEEDFDNRDNQPLYDGAPITRLQSAVAILAFALSYKLSGACINDLLGLIALHCLPNNLCLKSLYLFRKFFDMLGRKDSVRHYFCSGCEVPLETKTSVCGNCGGRSEVSFFLEFPLAMQLQGMFRRPEFYESLQFRNNRRKKK